MKILQLSYSKNRGGASKACLRIHNALRKNGIDSQMLTALSVSSNNEGVTSYCNTTFKQVVRKIKKVFNLALAMWLQKTPNQDLHTFDIGSVVSPEDINRSDADIVHLHWISYSMLGIKALRKIKKPIIWTFHDMWPFMGCEHYDDLSQPNRFKEGYTKLNKNVKGLDMNRRAWEMKQKYWKDIDFHIITPSNWLKSCVEESVLLKKHKVTLIPYIIEEDKFFSMDKSTARKALNLPVDKQLILFGAFNANNVNKGGDLLYAALENLNVDDVELIVFGTDKGDDIHGIKTTYMGYISSEEILNRLYNAADVMLVPSRQDNLPNTVLESICCGTPVVGFNIGGLPDMVAHQKSGYLASPFDVNDLRAGIEYVLENPEGIDFHANCRAHFESNFSEKVVIPQVIEYYQDVMKGKG